MTNLKSQPVTAPTQMAGFRVPKTVMMKKSVLNHKLLSINHALSEPV